MDPFLSWISIGRLNIFVDSVNIKRVLTCLVQLACHTLAQLYHILSDINCFFFFLQLKVTFVSFQFKFTSKSHEKILWSTLSIVKALLRSRCECRQGRGEASHQPLYKVFFNANDDEKRSKIHVSLVLKITKHHEEKRTRVCVSTA